MEVVLPEKACGLAPDPVTNQKSLFSAYVFLFRPHSSLICARDYGLILQIRTARYQEKSTCLPFSWQGIGLPQTWALESWSRPLDHLLHRKTPAAPHCVCGPLLPAPVLGLFGTRGRASLCFLAAALRARTPWRAMKAKPLAGSSLPTLPTVDTPARAGICTTLCLCVPPSVRPPAGSRPS